jgi:hypothetical protein
LATRELIAVAIIFWTSFARSMPQARIDTNAG